ncbi:MAG: glycosyltransferase [Saprospiraceae bacterium]|nr:glycosyltransferase [Saprospiraceae bacterium]MBK6477858.1 glycosyltransferase [Saprospiraceae bacterium]MBK6816268.1 glycosyltransferase [Saprospiraceae bacterium]MBK7370380.1 glycosyltransferase [Saprospiraceae bacterium]MBK7438088.1 glycosyltransferase [Saprospiraceae bacterium]
MDLSIVIPLLNEAESLPELESWLRRVMIANNYQYELIFIDDGSTDQSWSVIEALSKENDHVRGIKFRRNYGKAAALNTGFEASEGSFVITMDADLQDSPDEIPDLIKVITEQKLDLVSGWKKKRFDNTFSKNIPSKLYNFATSKMSGIKLHDMNCGLKIYRKEVVKNITVDGEMHRYIPVIAKWAGFNKIGEKVVMHQARKYGQTKFGFERFINGFLDLATILFVGKFGKKPMHLFGSFGILIFFVGFFLLGYLTIGKLFFDFTSIANRPMFYLGILLLIVGIQLFMSGFIAELVTRNSHQKSSYQIEQRIR